jgi:hypothetical protein
MWSEAMSVSSKNSPLWAQISAGWRKIDIGFLPPVASFGATGCCFPPKIEGRRSKNDHFT